MKKFILFWIILTVSLFSTAQIPPTENIIIVTTDGFRWQELFRGADSSILFNDRYVSDTQLMRLLYWDDSPAKRRAKLMPFLWSYVKDHGQLWGNRDIGNEVSLDNPYRLSYAGYNEMLTGYTDLSIKTNRARSNRQENIFSFLVQQPGFKDSVAVFASWRVMEQIIYNPEERFVLNAGYTSNNQTDVPQQLDQVNRQLEQYNGQKKETRNDMLTFLMAKEYMKARQPRVLYISLGETDEFAHQGRYDDYLHQASLVDKMLQELWMEVNRHPIYRGKTTLIFTTDHGRGSRNDQWIKHGLLIKGSEQTWMIQMGPGVEALGEMPAGQSIQTIQLAQTIASTMGLEFKAKNHPVAEAINLVNNQAHKNDLKENTGRDLVGGFK